MDFKRYFAGQEDKLAAELTSLRAALAHPGNKGQRSEDAFREFLSNHLPRSLEVGHGEAIDSENRNAGSVGGNHQIDVMIIADYHPRFARIDQASTYMIEGILAGGEVKTSLKLSQIPTVMNQAVAFKELYQVLGKGDLIVSGDEDMRRFARRRPYFLFAYEANASLKAIVARVMSEQLKLAVGDTVHFDAIFVLGKGCAYNLGNGKTAFGMIGADGQKVTGWAIVPGPTLIALIAWLSAVMPAVIKLSPVVMRYLFPHPPLAGC